MGRAHWKSMTGRVNRRMVGARRRATEHMCAELADWPVAKDTGSPLCLKVTRDAIDHYNVQFYTHDSMLLFRGLPTSQPPGPHRLSIESSNSTFVEYSEQVYRRRRFAILRAVLPSAAVPPEITLSTIAPFVRSDNRTIEPIPHFSARCNSVELDTLRFPIERVRNEYRCTWLFFR